MLSFLSLDSWLLRERGPGTDGRCVTPGPTHWLHDPSRILDLCRSLFLGLEDGGWNYIHLLFVWLFVCFLMGIKQVKSAITVV